MPKYDAAMVVPTNTIRSRQFPVSAGQGNVIAETSWTILLYRKDSNWTYLPGYDTAIVVPTNSVRS